MNADEVSKNLWVGSVPTDPAAVSKKFDALVLAAKEFQDVFPSHLYPKTDLILAPMADSKITDSDKYQALKAALSVRAHLDAGKKVLVTCAHGVNRSAMVAALAMLLGKESAKSAVDAIRKKRKPLVKAAPLSNLSFVKFINEVWDAVNIRKPSAPSEEQASHPTAA